MNQYKKDFPLLVNNPNLVYLDNAASTQKPHSVIQGMSSFYAQHYAPVKRGMYQLAEQATTLYENARVRIAQFIGAQADEIFFVLNATHGINTIALAWAQHVLKPGDEIVISELEHHSNLLPWQELASAKNYVLSYLSVNEHGVIELHELLSKISHRTKLVCCSHVSNVFGTLQDVSALIERAHEVGALVLLDAAQSVPYGFVDVKTLDCDFLVFSGHKMLGPTGIGVVYVKKFVQAVMKPTIVGGGMVFEADYYHARYIESPHCFEAGSPPVAQVIGLGYAVDYLAHRVNCINLKKDMAALCDHFIEGLGSIDDIKVLGDRELLSKQGHMVSFVHERYHPHDIGAFLDQHGVCVRTGHFCAQPLVKKLGIAGAVRASFYLYNDHDDVERIINILQQL